MPHLSNDRGSLVLKRRFRGVSPIRRATGTKDPSVVAQIDVMLHALYNQGRLDQLEAIARGRLHPLTALSQWRAGKELELPAPELMPSLVEAWKTWEVNVPGDEHRSSIGTTRRGLNIPMKATIDALPDLLDTFMERSKAKVRTVILARNHCRAFLRDLKGIGTDHPLYAKVAAIRPPKRKKREKGTPHPLPALLALQDKLNGLAGQTIKVGRKNILVPAGVGDMLWTMAATSMRNKEYWKDGFEVHRDRVQIYGKKTDSSERLVPFWSAPLVKPVLWEGHFRDVLRYASEGRVAIYDLRRSFRRWCQEAGIVEMNIDAYMGHGPKTMGQLYAWGELPGQFAADAAKLKAYRESQVSLTAEAVS